jgi:hypothetical protein
VTKYNAYQRKYTATTKGKLARNKAVNKYRKTTKGRLISCFFHIKERCENYKHPAYSHYGGRGIKCKFKSCKEFVDYIINELQIDPKGLEIDRIDNNGHYEKGNVRFVTHKENCNNKNVYNYWVKK